MCLVEEGVEIFILTLLSKPLETLCSEGSHGILIKFCKKAATLQNTGCTGCYCLTKCFPCSPSLSFLPFLLRTPPHLLFSSPCFSPHLRGVEPYDPPTTVLVQRNEPQGVSTILSSTDFFQSEHNRRVILEQVDSFQLREKYMFATTTRVRELWEGSSQHWTCEVRPLAIALAIVAHAMVHFQDKHLTP